jgi:Leucine-rich repeat (LRR) protein
MDSKITNIGIENLSKLTRLRRLNLRGAKITDAGVAQLVRNHPHLEYILFWYCTSLTDKALENLAESQLKYLGLRGTNVSDSGLAHLREMKSLRRLKLDYCSNVTDEGLSYLRDLQTLTFIGLDGCSGVTNASLEHLRGLTNLEQLDLRRTQVTDTGKAGLKKALPNCEIKF